MCIEAKRIRFLVERDGLKEARAWIERTLSAYRQYTGRSRSPIQPERSKLFSS
jgi:hypothetical protein